MFHGPLALLMRSIRADALARRGHFIRLAAVLGVLVLLVLALLRTRFTGSPGAEFLHSTAGLGIVLISLAGIGHFSTAITEEKEDGTLALLLLANIPPLAILLGKSTSRILSSWLLIAAMLPFGVLSLTLGGLHLWQVLAVIVALGAYLFLVANLALLVSVWVNRANEATSVMILLMLLMHGFPPWVKWLAPQLLSAPGSLLSGLFDHVLSPLAEVSFDHSVWQAILRILPASGTAEFAYGQLIWSVLFGLCCFALAWVRFRRVVWVTEPASTGNREHTGQGWRMHAFVSRPWPWALIWKDFHFITGGWTVCLFKCVALIGFACLCRLGGDRIGALAGIHSWNFAQQAALLVVGIELLAYASQLYHVERRWGTLPTLLMLPHTIPRITLGKVAGCGLALLPTLLITMILYTIHSDDPHYERPDFANSKVVWTLCGTAILAQLTVYCSLIVRWGALPLAIGILVTAVFVATPFLIGASLSIGTLYQQDLGGVTAVLYFTAVATFLLQAATMQQIAVVAGRTS